MIKKRYSNFNLNFTRMAYYSLAILSVIVLVLLILAFIIPFVSAVSPAFSKKTISTVEQTGDVAKNEFSTIRKIASSMFYTLKIALSSTFIAFIIGLPAAFFLAKRNFHGRKLLSLVSAIPLCTPPLLIALGFVMFFGMNGNLNRFLISVFHLSKPPLTFLYSFWGIAIAQGFYNFPIIMQTCANVWEKLPQDESDAACILGASKFRIFRTITLRQLVPSIASGATLVFLYCFFSFVIVMMFGSIGGSTLEIEIYQAARSSFNFTEAAQLSLVETFTALSTVFIWSVIEKHCSRSSGLLYDNDNLRTNISDFKEKIFFFLLFSIIALFLFLPLAGIIWRAFSSFSIKTLFRRSSFPMALLRTIIVSISASLLATIAATTFTIISKKTYSKKSGAFSKTMSLLPMSVSSVVLGLGFILLVPRGTPFVLIIAEAAITWPFALKQISSQFDRIPLETIEAALLLSKNKMDLIFRIYLPMIKTGIASAFAFCFSIASGDATLPLVLAVPRFDTLALFTYRLAGAYRFDEACASGTVLGLLSASVFLLGEYFGKIETSKKDRK